MSYKFYRRSLGKVWLSLALLSIMSFPSVAQANPVALALSVRAPMLTTAVLGTGSVCTAFFYDLNGNRTSVAFSTIGAVTTSWGAGTFGCFVWGQ